jgi:hypothetical protein
MPAALRLFLLPALPARMPTPTHPLGCPLEHSPWLGIGPHDVKGGVPT